MFEEYPDVLNFEELTRALNIGKNKAYELLKENKIEHFKIGANYKIPKKSIIKYIQNEMDKNNLT